MYLAMSKLVMIKKVIIALLFFCLYSCSTVGWKTKSFDLNTKNQVICSDVLFKQGFEDIRFIKNKEFRKIEKFLRKKHKATYIRNIFYVESKEQYYCEFNINDYTINCLFLDKNFKVISFDELVFDL